MASSDLVILLSSPARTSKLDRGIGTVSSSPSAFPSPMELIRSQTQTKLRTGSRAASIPRHATGFTTASTLFQTAREEGGSNGRDIFDFGLEIESIIPQTEQTEKSRPVRKSRAKKIAADDTDPSAPKPRKARARKTDQRVETENSAAHPGEDAIPNEKPARKKPRAKKTNDEAQTKLPRSRVTKGSTSKSKLVTAGVTKQNDGKTDSVETIVKNVASLENSINDTLRLSLAEKRRTEWTPPKPSVKGPSLDLDSAESPTQYDTSYEAAPDRLDILGSFGYQTAGDGNKDTQRPATATVAVKKRKLLELVPCNSLEQVKPETAAKKRVSKKKAMTITELATAEYRHAGASEPQLPMSAPMLQYISYKNGEASTESMNLEGFKIPAKPRTKSPVRIVKRIAKPKKLQRIDLMSPESALKQADKQAYVFGTSSQLTREDSPSLLRDMNQAMVESNQLCDNTVLDMTNDALDQTPKACFIGSKGVVLFPGTRNLWAVGSSGEFMDIETVDMTKTPKVGIQRPTQDCVDSRIDQRLTKNLSVPDQDDEWLNLLDTPVAPSRGTLIIPKIPEKNFTVMEVANSVRVDNEIISIDSPKPAAKIPIVRKSPKQAMPDFENLTTESLTKRVTSYGFKMMKSRTTMIALLEKCWNAKEENRQRQALEPLVANRALSTSPAKAQAKKKDSTGTDGASSKRGRPKKISHPLTAPPKRAVGRPRGSSTLKKSPAKRATISVEAIDADHRSDSDAPLAVERTPQKKRKSPPPQDEIDDSDFPITPTPPRRLASKVGSPPKALDLVNDESVILSPTSQQLELHRFITKAVTSVPPSADPKNPTWHEKILLYDPIILEDLAAWLNTGALQKVGYDGEVEPKDVKTWCMEKSVCCLWRKNYRGGDRARF